jgi:hypothetical protein
MSPNEYLEEILRGQTFDNDAPELSELRKRRKEIEDLLRTRFSKSAPSIRWGGSMAKGTMIREAYDGDMTCYFPHEDSEAGSNLEEIYENVATVLGEEFEVERKTSALRVKDPSTKEAKGFAEDLHIDVVPGRFTSDDEGDVFLHRTTGDKARLKTNLQVHIDHIKGSGVTEAIRLMKLWNVRNGIGAKTFVLELLVVKLLKERKNAGLARQLEHVWTEFRDKASELAVEDPANPTGNELTPILDQVRHRLSSVAATTLELIESSGWETIFGPIAEEGEDDRKSALQAAAVHVANPTRPWLPGA